MKKILSIIFFILFLVSLILTVLIRYDEISVPYFKGVRKSVQVDVMYKNKITNIYYNDKPFEKNIKIDKNKVLFGTDKYSKIKKITFEDKSSIEKLNVYLGNQVIEYKNIPDSIEINNEKNIFSKIAIIFLSFFYNFKLFCTSYLFLILFLTFFENNIKLSKKLLFVSITLLALFLRLIQLNEIPFWNDEIYILVHTSKYAKFIEMFNDPGNPPLYFIVFKIWRNLVFNKEEYFRILALITGLLFNFAFYKYIKHWLKEKKALGAYFIASILLILIYFSQEIRCYMFLMLFSILSSILLFNFDKNKKWYFINAICLLNTHFYGIFILLYNFIFGISLFYKKKKRLLSFLIINFASFLIFIPNVLFKHQSLTSSFNTWIKKPCIYDVEQVLLNFSAFWFVFVLFSFVVIFLYLKSKNKKHKLFLKYNYLAIISVMAFSFAFSYIVKPIFLYRYFYVIHPQYLALCIFVVTYKYKTFYRYFLGFIFFILFMVMGRLNTQNLYNNSDLYYNFVKQDIDTKKNNFVFFNNTVENYDVYENDLKNKANIIYVRVDGEERNSINPAMYDIKKPSVCYIINLYLEKEVYKDTNLIEIYKTPLGFISKVEYKN